MPNVIDPTVATKIGHQSAVIKYWRSDLRMWHLYSFLEDIYPVEERRKDAVRAADLTGAVHVRALVITKGEGHGIYYAREIASCELDMQLNKAMIETPRYGIENAHVLKYLSQKLHRAERDYSQYKGRVIASKKVVMRIFSSKNVVEEAHLELVFTRLTAWSFKRFTH
jgi:hypothetical protein